MRTQTTGRRSEMSLHLNELFTKLDEGGWTITVTHVHGCKRVPIGRVYWSDHTPQGAVQIIYSEHRLDLEDGKFTVQFSDGTKLWGAYDECIMHKDEPWYVQMLTRTEHGRRACITFHNEDIIDRYRVREATTS